MLEFSVFLSKDLFKNFLIQLLIGSNSRLFHVNQVFYYFIDKKNPGKHMSKEMI